MALKNEIDTEDASRRLATWLESKIDGAEHVRVTDLDVPASAGLSNETVLFTAAWNQDGQANTRAMVARVQPAGPGVFASYDLGKEAKVITALAAQGVPLPAVYAYEQDPAVFGSPFLVMQRVDGRVPSDDPPFTAGGWVLDLTAEQRTTMWHNSLTALAQIHDADWRALGLDFLDTEAHGSGVHAQIANWRESFGWAAEGESNPTIELALQWLAENVPARESSKVLNWGDARVGNIIFGDDLAAAAVLDWEMVTLGSRELDLGWWLFLMRHHTEGIGLPLPKGIPDRDATLAYYTSITGHVPVDIDYYEILAATKLAIIMVRAAHMMIAMGLMPADSPMAVNNPASQLLAKLLGLPAPTGETATFIGNR
ncbi:phosphotransferase family protein [Mycobacterium sp. shizuoka-1]|uniref:phosphotransferase family protein n=1 Tax=Mycobacterium sp. shizuoka-1 TaxID=2039281 RepID=UPI000C06314F|nr:phosphotransferase family protein [Mycobacterium sp. shizuoka-1]GAY18623.1 putative phosphotransferase [Mycobacterium sp. shizuoka-1]